jgi:hypothetical protein
VEGLGPNDENPDFSIETMQIGLDKCEVGVDRNTETIVRPMSRPTFSTTPVAPRSIQSAWTQNLFLVKLRPLVRGLFVVLFYWCLFTSETLLISTECLHTRTSPSRI